MRESGLLRTDVEAMITETPARRTLTRRHVLFGAAAVATIIAAGGTSVYPWSPIDTATAQTSTGADVSMADLLVPGPLGDEIQGQADAPVTIVEYASMTCPHCSHFHETTYPEMKKKYIDTGKVRFIFREFPLDPLAAAAAMLARCAGKDKYFPLVDAFFAQQKDWVVQKPLQPMFAIAKQAGFTQQSFDECLANQQLLNNLEEQRTRAAQKFNVNSTPTFFINGKTVRGALTPEELDKQIAPYLKG
jgi:protein-disulfide isomerase